MALALLLVSSTNAFAFDGTDTTVAPGFAGWVVQVLDQLGWGGATVAFEYDDSAVQQAGGVTGETDSSWSS